MDSLFVGLVLASAALYAGWHTFVNASGDRLVALATIALGYAVTGALMIPFVGTPLPGSWPYIAATTPLYYFFWWLLNRLYLIGELSHAFPLSRGAAPLFVTIGAAPFAGEWLHPLAALGAMLACVGVMSLAVLGASATRERTTKLYWLAGTGSLVIAAMLVSNGLGARASGAPFSYMAWVFLLQAAVVALTTAFRRGQLSRAIGTEPVKVVGTGACATIAYGLSIYASAYAPMGGVAALRETSVVMAALVGTIVLGERPWLPRVLAACVVTAGAALVATDGPR